MEFQVAVSAMVFFFLFLEISHIWNGEAYHAIGYEEIDQEYNESFPPSPRICKEKKYKANRHAHHEHDDGDNK